MQQQILGKLPTTKLVNSMSIDSNSRMAVEYRKELIVKNLSQDTCNECKHFHFALVNRSFCSNPDPKADNCVLLKTYYEAQ